MVNDVCASLKALYTRHTSQRMAVALRKKNNAVDERFGLALWGLQVFTGSVLPALERQPNFLHPVALRVQIPITYKYRPDAICHYSEEP